MVTSEHGISGWLVENLKLYSVQTENVQSGPTRLFRTTHLFRDLRKSVSLAFNWMLRLILLGLIAIMISEHLNDSLQLKSN